MRRKVKFSWFLSKTEKEALIRILEMDSFTYFDIELSYSKARDLIKRLLNAGFIIKEQ